MGRRAGVRPDETREELLTAALEVLRERGYEGTRVSEIVRRAGVTTGALYAHFPSKAELLAAAVTERGPAVLAGLLSAADDRSLLDAVRAAGSALPAEMVDAAPLLVELIATSARDAEVGAVVRRSLGARRAGVAQIVATAQRNGEIDPDLGADAVARFALLLGLGAAVASVLDLEPVGGEEWDQVVDRMVDAVRPEEVGR